MRPANGPGPTFPSASPEHARTHLDPSAMRSISSRLRRQIDAPLSFYKPVAVHEGRCPAMDASAVAFDRGEGNGAGGVLWPSREADRWTWQTNVREEIWVCG